MKKNSISVVFITKNEEFHIGDAIDNVKDFAEEIFVVDSGSTDKTVEIAEAKGAKVLLHLFETFGKQWNWALDNCPIKTRWTMKMDPDERLSSSLKENITQRLDQKDDVTGYEFDRILWFMGKPMRGWRDRVLRIWRTGRCRFTDSRVNEHPLVDGLVQFLPGVMEHYDSCDLHRWVEKQNFYTTIGLLAKVNGDKAAVKPSLMGTRLARRNWFKKVFFRIPGRYFLMFLQLYFLKGLWREGRTGYWCACMRIWVRRLYEGKIIEYQNTGRLTKM